MFGGLGVLRCCRLFASRPNTCAAHRVLGHVGASPSDVNCSFGRAAFLLEVAAASPQNPIHELLPGRLGETSSGWLGAGWISPLICVSGAW